MEGIFHPEKQSSIPEHGHGREDKEGQGYFRSASFDLGAYGHPLEDHLGGGQKHEVIVGQGGIVARGAHVGGQVGVDVWITEVRNMFICTFTGVLQSTQLASRDM